MSQNLIFKITALSVSIVAILVGGFVWWSQREPEMGGDFQLTHLDSPWKFSDNVKPLSILYVGYAKCPDVCPLSLSHSGQAFQKLDAKELEQVQLIFLSVDHANDTAENVATYAKQFFPAFIGLTGDKDSIDKTVDLFGASYMVDKDPKSYLGYSIAHTDRLFFLDRDGHVIDSIQNPRSAELILSKIRSHL
ncbi:MAG: SCO family protein [Bdellovibrionota bacterium]